MNFKRLREKLIFFFFFTRNTFRKNMVRSTLSEAIMKDDFNETMILMKAIMKDD